MSRLSAWLQAAPFRQCRIWWHDRYGLDGYDKSEIWWHCDLSEHMLEPGGIDHGKRLAHGHWTKRESVWTGYDRDLSKAISKALKLAKEGK